MSFQIKKQRKKHLFLLILYFKQTTNQMFDDKLNNYHNNSPQGEQDEYNQLAIKKKKTSFLKKKKLPSTKLYSNIDLKHVVNIGGICFMNEDALRNPNTSEETLLKSLYHYNSITKVTLNNSFISIDLKKNCESILPPEYFFERLRSFGDQQMADMALSLEKINTQFCCIKDTSPDKQQAFTRDAEQILLANFLQSRGNKKYFLYFSEISSQKITMKNIIFSVPLLQALGCNIKNIGLDFLKQKHVFFEVFTAKNYGNVLQGCFQRFSNIQAHLMLNPNISEEQRRVLTEMIYYDEVIRKKQGKEGIYEQISKAKVMWYSPHPSISYFEILELDEAVGLMATKKQNKCLFEETKPEQEIQMLRKIGIDDSLIKIEDGFNQKQLCDSLSQ